MHQRDQEMKPAGGDFGCMFHCSSSEQVLTLLPLGKKILQTTLFQPSEALILSRAAELKQKIHKCQLRIHLGFWHLLFTLTETLHNPLLKYVSVHKAFELTD